MAHERIGVCVLNWNAGEMLHRCLDAVTKNLSGLAPEIVVVDNASSDGSVETTLLRFPQVSVIRSEDNLGYARGNNLGLHHLAKRGCVFLLVLNPDAILEVETVPSMMAALSRNSTAGCCGGIQENGAGPSRMSCRTKPTPLQNILLYGPLARFSFSHPHRARHFLDPLTLADGAEVYAVSGACMLMRSSAFLAVGGFDEATFLYGEEFILSERMSARGWTTIVSNKAHYFHVEGHSTNQIPTLRRLHFIRSEQYLLRAYFRWSAAVRFSTWTIRMLELPGFVLKNALRSLFTEVSA